MANAIEKRTLTVTVTDADLSMLTRNDLLAVPHPYTGMVVFETEHYTPTKTRDQFDGNDVHHHVRLSNDDINHLSDGGMVTRSVDDSIGYGQITVERE